MTRALAVSTSYPLSESDTTAPFVRSISRGLCDHGFDVTMLLPDHDALAWDGADGPVDIVTFRYRPSAWGRLQVWGYAAGLQSDVRLEPAALMIAPVALAATTRKLLRLTRELEPDVLHAHWVVPSGVPAAVVARLTDTPLTISLHGSDVYLCERLRSVRGGARVAFRTAQAWTACSRELADRAIGLGAEPDRVDVIPYGVDTDRFRPGRDRCGDGIRDFIAMNPDAPVVLAAGRLVRKKGFGCLVDAVARLAAAGTRCHLVIAGSGAQDDALTQRARERGIASRVHLIGDVSRDRIPSLYRAAEILAVPSVRAGGNVDGLPNVLLEGLASGLPVAASRIAGIPDVVRHGVNGLLADPGDEVDLADVLGRLITDGDLRRRLGDAARRTVEEDLTWETVTRRYGETLERSTRGRRG